MTRRCKKCYLPESHPNVKFNSDRICNYCLDETEIVVDGSDYNKVPESVKTELKKDFECFLKSCKGKSEYDCLLLFSGGKDSSYLLYLLTKKYGLKVLAVTVNTGLEKERSVQNAKKIAKFFWGRSYFCFTRKQFV